MDMKKIIVSICVIGLMLISSGAFANAFDKRELSMESMAEGNTLIVEFGGNKTFNGDRVIEVDYDGNIVWEYGGMDKPQDVERLPNGNTLITVYAEQRVIEVNSAGTIVWEKTGLIEPMDAERLPNGNTLITEYGGNRVIEIDNGGSIVWEKTGLDRPFDAERLGNGNTLITECGANRVIEVGNGGIVWEKTGLNAPVDAERLCNGNTLITEHVGMKVSEVDSAGNEVWNKTGLHVPKDAERLGNGNTLIAECGANRVIEVDSSGATVWLKADLFYPTDVERLGQPPFAPTITGETNGSKGTEYEYTFNACDPDGDNVYYDISWGDGTSTGWFGTYPSGEDVKLTHTWEKKGTYYITAKAKDVFGNVGPEGTLEVTMPKNKAFNFNLLGQLFERSQHTRSQYSEPYWDYESTLNLCYKCYNNLYIDAFKYVNCLTLIRG